MNEDDLKKHLDYVVYLQEQMKLHTVRIGIRNGQNFVDWSTKNIGEVVAEENSAEDFVFLCQCGITPDLSLGS